MTGFRAKNKKDTGFTIIELMVSASVLVVILLVLAGVFSSYIKSVRRDQAIQTLIDESRFTLELTKREIRTAYANSFAIPDGNRLYFRNQNGDCVQYRLNEGTASLERVSITKAKADRILASEPEFCESLDFENDSDSVQSITGANIAITNLEFTVENDRRSIGMNIEFQALAQEEVKTSITTIVSSRQIISYDTSF